MLAASSILHVLMYLGHVGSPAKKIVWESFGIRTDLRTPELYDTMLSETTQDIRFFHTSPWLTFDLILPYYIRSFLQLFLNTFRSPICMVQDLGSN